MSVPDLNMEKMQQQPSAATSTPSLGKGSYSVHGVESMYSLNVTREMQGFRGSNDFILQENRRQSIVDTTKEMGSWAQRKYRQIFRRKVLFKRVPILNWMPKYSFDDAVGDLIAGITVKLFFFKLEFEKF